MKLLLALVIVSFALVPYGRTDEKQADPVKVALDKAWTSYWTEVDKADQAFVDIYDKAENTARQKGDKVTLDRIKSERLEYLLAGNLPKNGSVAIQQRLANAKRDLDSSYVQTVKAYTKAAKDEKADTAQKELNELRKRPPTRYFAIVNEKSGLVLTPSKITADRGVGLVQTKNADELYQQWCFVSVNQAGVFLIQNRLSGHFVNIDGAHMLGRQVTLWSFDGAEHNHWLISRTDKHIRIRDANGEGFLAPIEATTEEEKPVVQSAKGDGNEQLWKLVPIKSK